MDRAAEQKQGLDAARSAVALKLPAVKNEGKGCSLSSTADMLEQLAQPGRSRRRREAFLRAIVAELVHLPSDVRQLEELAFAAAAE